MSARLCYRNDSDYEEDIKIVRSEAAEIDDFLDMYNVEKTNSYRINLDHRARKNFNGIVISVSKGRPVVFVIDNQMSCSEKIGVIITFPEGLSRDDFIGSVITNVKWGKEKRAEYDCFSEIIVETTIGNLTLTAFNEHNGYYSHAVIACFNDKVEHFSL